MTTRQTETDPEVVIPIPTDTQGCQTDTALPPPQVYTQGCQTDEVEEPEVVPEPRIEMSFTATDGAGGKQKFSFGSVPDLLGDMTMGNVGYAGAGGLDASVAGGLDASNQTAANASLLGLTTRVLAKSMFPNGVVFPEPEPTPPAQTYTQGCQTDPIEPEPEPEPVATCEGWVQAEAQTEDSGFQTDPLPEPEPLPPPPEPLLKSGYASRKPIRRTAELLSGMYAAQSANTSSANGSLLRTKQASINASHQSHMAQLEA